MHQSEGFVSQEEVGGKDGVPKAAPPEGAPSQSPCAVIAASTRKLRKRRVRRTPDAGQARPFAPGPVMEPLVVLREGPAPTDTPPPRAGGVAAAHQLVEVDVEREVIGTRLYRERRIEERVVEVDVRPPTREERRAARGRERVRAALRKHAPAEGGLRATLGYKLFYDLVCNRLGLVLAGFGSAMLLFVMLYDPVRRQPLEFGPMHLLGLAVAGVVYLVGMVLEMLRAWSWECDAAEMGGTAPVGSSGMPVPARKEAALFPAPIPLVPEDAVERLRIDLGKRGAL